MIQSYSQAGQDIFVSSLINSSSQHFFVDVGCWMPETINNTFLLEKKGWIGVSVDILDLHKEWSNRTNKFIQANAITLDYKDLFTQNNLPEVIDYLNVDIEGNGSRFEVLKKVFDSGHHFKIITIEHDIYRGYEATETIPQREFLWSRGYELLCSNVRLSGNPFEDWWINPYYLKKDSYAHLKSNELEFTEIIKKLNI